MLADEAEGRSMANLVLDGHDRVVLGRVDVQHVVAVLATQVIGDIGEGSAGRLGHAVVDNDHVVFAVGWQQGQRVSLPEAILRVPLLNLSNLVPGDGSLCGAVGTEGQTYGEFRMSNDL